MKIYTRNGDKGETQLIGKKVSKTDLRVEAYGTTDELNSFIGLAVANLNNSIYEDLRKDLMKIQHELFDLGGDLANVKEKKEWATKEEYVTYLEKRIDTYWEEAPPLQSFILPGGEQGGAYLHVCRTIARRAERQVLHINDTNELPPFAIKYLNRLSDFFFAAARAVNARSKKEDVQYKKGSNHLSQDN
ncbi:cob(I)alamin adenosyltransferase [Evansella vedderi]|uniref:Corrinoid adenosyltransferase n=1 Tax=Evansella vedderi TaxID=38282 RepID=A0ABU0A2H0_9BACI|nr:cob(I)yrinic acid a,c-diamide adenosyltransferase [Evansella vedderi]MDQ0257685.1 cob(I)alamin adenosyltransferase [Evansella vedderi]